MAYGSPCEFCKIFQKKLGGGSIFSICVFKKKIPEKIFEFINKVVYMQYK